VQITTVSLPNWTEGIPYQQTLAAVGGTGKLDWVDQNSGLSGTGLSLMSNGILAGTPNGPRQINFTARATDQVGAFGERAFSFTINAEVAITTASLPDGEQGTAYSFQLQSTGGTGTKTWSDKNNNLSGTGLTFSADGLLSGVPGVYGPITFTARVADELGSAEEKEFTFNIAKAILSGDANADTFVDVSDATWIINYVFIPGSPEPDPYEAGEVNCDSIVDVSDAVYIINYIFVSGPVPCDCEEKYAK